MVGEGSAINIITESLERALSGLDALQGLQVEDVCMVNNSYPLDVSEIKESVEMVQRVLDQFRGTSQYFSSQSSPLGNGVTARHSEKQKKKSLTVRQELELAGEIAAFIDKQLPPDKYVVGTNPIFLLLSARFGCNRLPFIFKESISVQDNIKTFLKL